MPLGFSGHLSVCLQIKQVWPWAHSLGTGWLVPQSNFGFYVKEESSAVAAGSCDVGSEPKCYVCGYGTRQGQRLMGKGEGFPTRGLMR